MYKPWDRLCRVMVCYKSDGDVKPTITEDMRASAEVSAAQWNDYQTRFAPFEQKFMDDVTRDSGNTLNTIKGQVNADLQQKVAASGGPTAGFDPSRGDGMSVTAVGKGLSAGFNAAQKGVGDQQVQNLNTVVGMGRGQAVEAVGGLSDLAVSSGQTALTRSISDATESMNERGARMQLAGQALGTAGAIGMNYAQPASTALTNTVTANANNTVANGGNSLMATNNALRPAAYNGLSLSPGRLQY